MVRFAIVSHSPVQAVIRYLSFDLLPLNAKEEGPALNDENPAGLCPCFDEAINFVTKATNFIYSKGET